MSIFEANLRLVMVKKMCTMKAKQGHPKHKGNPMKGYATTPVPPNYVSIVELSWCNNHSYDSLSTVDVPNLDISHQLYFYNYIYIYIYI